MNIIGISAHFHDAACCLLKDGALIAAAEEERFSRAKHDPRIPGAAFRYCLMQGGLQITDIDAVAYYETPVKKAARQLWTQAIAPGASVQMLNRIDPSRAEYEIRELLGYEGQILFFDHHESHAAGAYYYSGFRDAALLTVDGVGEWATTTYGSARDGVLSIFEEVRFPHSIGLLYSALTSYLGFDVNDAEYKVMGLAPYGQARYVDRLHSLLENGADGQFRLNLKYFDFMSHDRMFTEALIGLFGQPEREPESEIGAFHQDVARSLQVVLDETLLQKVRYLYSRVGGENLCISGGVALNCVTNGLIRRAGPFKDVFIPPAPSDAGSCLGAAALAHLQLKREPIPRRRLQHSYLGPALSNGEIRRLLDAAGIEALDFRGDEAALLSEVAARLAEGEVIGWAHGRMEFGPRALGNRSILADPRLPQMRERVNSLVKKRETFRPFAPAVLEEYAGAHFALEHATPFMLETLQVQSDLSLQAVTHVDGSARVQTVSRSESPRFWRLIDEFRIRTGCPVLLNTSFNVRGEPIVCTPRDAILCFVNSGLDTLVLEDYIVPRSALPASLLSAMAAPQGAPLSPQVLHNAYRLA
jgi:carbamoyltransferase